MNKLLKLITAIIVVVFTYSQGISQNVGISSTTITPDLDAILEVRSTTKGVLLPRMTTAERGTLSTDLGT